MAFVILVLIIWINSIGGLQSQTAVDNSIIEEPQKVSEVEQGDGTVSGVDEDAASIAAEAIDLDTLGNPIKTGSVTP